MRARSLVEAVSSLALARRLSWNEADRLLRLEDEDVRTALEDYLLELHVNGHRFITERSLACYEALR